MLGTNSLSKELSYRSRATGVKCAMPESAADIRTKWIEFGPSDLSGSKDYRLSGLCAVLGDL